MGCVFSKEWFVQSSQFQMDYVHYVTIFCFNDIERFALTSPKKRISCLFKIFIIKNNK